MPLAKLGLQVDGTQAGKSKITDLKAVGAVARSMHGCGALSGWTNSQELHGGGLIAVFSNVGKA